VVAQVADKCLECGVLDHGFARIRCDACTHEYLLAFSCKCRDCCPSGHAKRLAIWTPWLDTTLLAPVPHRHVVLTIPKRLRAYGLYRRRLLGEIARVAARTVTAAIRTLTGERDLADDEDPLDDFDGPFTSPVPAQTITPKDARGVLQHVLQHLTQVRSRSPTSARVGRMRSP
jgi:hypothetical protein